MTDKRLFYFSRCKAQSPLSAKWLVSGLIEAESLDQATAQLAEALAKTQTRADEFLLVDVATTERGSTGLIAITMAHAS